MNDTVVDVDRGHLTMFMNSFLYAKPIELSLVIWESRW